MSVRFEKNLKLVFVQRLETPLNVVSNKPKKMAHKNWCQKVLPYARQKSDTR